MSAHNVGDFVTQYVRWRGDERGLRVRGSVELFPRDCDPFLVVRSEHRARQIICATPTGHLRPIFAKADSEHDALQPIRMLLDRALSEHAAYWHSQVWC